MYLKIEARGETFSEYVLNFRSSETAMRWISTVSSSPCIAFSQFQARRIEFLEFRIPNA